MHTKENLDRAMRDIMQISAEMMIMSDKDFGKWGEIHQNIGFAIDCVESLINNKDKV